MFRSILLATTLAVGAAPAIAWASEPAAVVETTKVQAPTPSEEDATSYAQREQQNPKAASFQGGNLLIVGVSGGAILVVLFLLLLLA